MVKLGEHFASDDRSRHSEWLRQQRWFIKARQDNQRRDDIVEKQDDNFAAFAGEVIATQTQIAEFNARLDIFENRLDEYETQLDAYDTAIMKALLRNQEKLLGIEADISAVEIRLQDMLAQATVMEDGRRVFKSDDGSFAVDEFGDDVDQDEIDFDLISGPSANQYLGELDFKETMTDARDEIIADNKHLLEAQNEIDVAREGLSEARESLQNARNAIEDGGLSVEDMEAFDAELLDAMPPSDLPTLPISAVKHLSGIETATELPAIKATFSANSDPASLTQQATVANPQFGLGG